MKKFYFVLLFFVLIADLQLFSQKPQKVTIKAIVVDTSKAVVPFATIMLLNPKDSTLSNFTTSNMQGEFTFSNVKNINYLLKISHINSLPYQLFVKESEEINNDLGMLILKPLNRTLVEVVIKAAKAPIYIKGDTIEYDATTFKIPPGSTVEDLLKRLPGIQVDANGNIMAQGKNIQKVYVDGKSFFGDDPKNVTKNLDAEAISKVQVFTEKSEQTKLTGVDDGSQEKAMNLELKDEFKKGKFGKLVLAGGTEDRWASRGSLNLFNEKHQLSFIGYANNINQTGVNWEDYQEFKGSNSFNNYDNGNFGFSSGNNYYYFDDVAFDYFDGKGFTNNIGAGTNYNYDSKKVKYNFSYFFNQSEYMYDEFSFTKNYLSDSTFTNTDTSYSNRKFNKHSASTRFQWDIDSNNMIIAKANGSLYYNTNNVLSNGLYADKTDAKISTILDRNDFEGNNYSYNGTMIFRHKFKRPGSSFALSASINNSKNADKNYLLTINDFYKLSTTRKVYLRNSDTNLTQNYRLNGMIANKLGKYWYNEVFYNFEKSGKNADNQSSDLYLLSKIDSLSFYGSKEFMYNRLGSSIRYSNKGLNISAGIAYQQNFTNYSFLKEKNGKNITNPIKRFYNNFIPNFNFSYQLPKNTHLRLNYSYQVDLPDESDILPTPIISSILFKQIGNPDLEPELRNSVSLSLNRWNPANFSSFGMWSSYSQNIQSIVYNQNINYVDSIGLITTRIPLNHHGGKSGNINLWSNFPWIKTVLSQNINVNGSISESFAFINSVENKTDSKNLGFGTGFSLTVTSKLAFDLDFEGDISQTAFSINKNQNQLNKNFGIDFSVKYQFYKKMYFESNFDFKKYESNISVLNQEIPIWNASVRKIFGKNNRLEVRLAVFDIFNKNVYFVQNSTANYYQKVYSPTLARYFMLSLSYDIRGFSDKMNEND